MSSRDSSSASRLPAILAAAAAADFEHLAHIETTTFAAVVATVLFNMLFLCSIFQMLRTRAWFFSAFSISLGIEAAGFVTLSYLSTHVRDHMAYLVSFATLTLAPSLLVLAIFAAFDRIMSSAVTRTELDRVSRLSVLPRTWLMCLVVAVEVLAIMCMTYGIANLAVLHSAKPITGREEVIKRLLSEASAVATLSTGYIMQLICLVLFMVVAHLSMPVARSAADRSWGNARWAILFATAFSLVRTGFKVSSFTAQDPKALDVFGSGTATLLMDFLPLLLAFGTLMRYYSTITAPKPPSAQPLVWVSEKSSLLGYDSAASC